MSAATERYHAFDALRAAMMFLGVVIHTACAYSFLPDTWWYYDPQRSRVYDLLLLFIHIFRLPVFFVMAGFFAGLLYERRGARATIGNRAARVLLPLVGAQVALYPVMRFLDAISWLMRGHRPDVWGRAVRFIASGEFLTDRFHLMHLWFLEYLFLWCVLGVLLAPLVARLDRVFRAAILSKWSVVCFAVPTAATLLAHEYGLLNTPRGPMPEAKIVAAYGVYFLAGWLLWRQRELLRGIKHTAWRRLAWAVPLAGVNAWGAMHQLAARPGVDWLGLGITLITGALVTWLMIFGLMGVFLRHANRADARLRYLSDSAYWVYLAHPPVLLVLQMLLFRLAWSPHVKFMLVLLVSLPILLASYHWLVRSTWVGATLNGRRQPLWGDARTNGLEMTGQAVGARPDTQSRVLTGKIRDTLQTRVFLI